MNECEKFIVVWYNATLHIGPLIHVNHKKLQALYEMTLQFFVARESQQSQPTLEVSGEIIFYHPTKKQLGFYYIMQANTSRTRLFKKLRNTL